MKALFATTFVLLAAAAALAHNLVINPTQATLVAGQTISVSVSNHAGFSPPLPLSANFLVSGPLVIDRVDTTTYGGKLVVIRALATGDGMLSAETPDGAPYGVIATLNVTTCGEAQPRVGMFLSRHGDEIDVSATGTPFGGTYEWFSGALGDTSHPISTLTPSFLWFYVRTDQPVQIWVRYSTPCGAATATGESNLRRRASRP